MLIYAIGSLTIVVFNIFLCTLILYRRKKTALILSYVLWSAVVSGWAFGYAITLSGLFDKSVTLFWNRFCHAMASLIPVFFLRLAFALTNRLEEKKKYMIVMYCLGASLIAIDFTPLFVKDLWQMMFFKYQPLGGPLYIYFTAFFFYGTIYAYWVLFDRVKKAHGNERQRLKAFLLGTIIGYTGGANLFLQAYHLNILPVGIFFISPYVVFTGYAIYKYEFLDIEVLVKKTLVFAGLFASILASVGLFILVLQQLLQYFLNKAISINLWMSLGMTIVFMMFTYDALKRFLIDVTNKYLFQKKYDPVELIRTFSRTVLTELDLNKITKSTVDKLSEALNLVSCAILIPNKEGNKFIIKESFGVQDKKGSYGMNAHIISYLSKVNNVVLKNGDKPLSEAIVKDMELINASVCLAIMIHKQLIGILCLGRKKSDEDYSKDDMDVLLLLTDALGVAITNALTFEDVRQKEKLATIGTLAAGIKHEIGTPINKMSSAVQSFLIAKEEGDHQKISSEEALSEAYNLLTRCQMTFEKVSTISAKFADFARPKRKSESEPINISESIEEALSVLDREIQAKNISVKKDIDKDLPLVIGDRDYMQQIFFNIIRNAAQAIQEAHRTKDESIITITAKGQPGKSVFIEIKDAGVGIPENSLSKIFEPYYTTKPEGKGTGLGLAIVKELVERTDGKISIKSELGKGASFILEFPGVRP